MEIRPDGSEWRKPSQTAIRADVDATLLARGPAMEGGQRTGEGGEKVKLHKRGQRAFCYSAVPGVTGGGHETYMCRL